MLNSLHLQEWTESAVNSDVARLNVESLSGYEPHEKLLYALPMSNRRNDGRATSSILNSYSHIENGGWWCNGVDVLTGDDLLLGQLKPDKPRSFNKKNKGFAPGSKTKTIKYEAPKNAPTEIFALKVTLPIWKAIALRYDVPLPENIVVTLEGRAIGFWTWVIATPKIPVIITEGAKKAGALLTAGYAAIALPGIYGAYRQPKDDYKNKIGSPYLIPEIEAFTQEGREIIFCFDNDTKPKTFKNVKSAIIKTGKLLFSKGCKVSVITWIFPEKGVDDLIFARRSDCFDDLYENRRPLSQFMLASLFDLSKYKPFRVNKRYLDKSLTAPFEAQIIGLRSPKGTGKTEWLSREVEQAIKQGRPVLVISHRIQLAKALCAKFSIDHVAILFG